jgi:hypothetical protein
MIQLNFDQAQQPKFYENKAKGFVEFGTNNKYPTYLVDLYNESAKHGAIIKSKAGYIFGQGFADDAGKGVANNKGETWNEVAKKCILDDEIHAGYYLQVVYNALGKIAAVFHIPFTKCRLSICGSKVFVKNKWDDFKEKPRLYDLFDPAKPEGTQIFMYKQYNPQSDIYPIPSYQQCLNYVESDVQIGRHILGNANQGFTGSTLINLNNGNPPDEDGKGEVEAAILKKFTGHDGKRVVLMFNSSKDNAADIQPLGQSILTKEDFTNINNLVQQEIFAGHRITSPTLFGIKTEGQLGGRNEIRDAYEIFTKTYVSERQQVHDAVFTLLKSYTLHPIEMTIEQLEPLAYEFGEGIVAANLTKDEIRGIMGKEPLDPSIKTQAQIISDNINALSPLVANKVLESMTSDEIRSLAGLQVATDLPAGQMPTVAASVNDAIANITGRQQQGLLRIVRLFTQGKLTKQQAAIQLQGFGFTDDQINQYLGLDDDPTTDDQKFSSQAEDEKLLAAFAECGSPKDNYIVVHSEPAKDAMFFAEQVNLTDLQLNVMDLISKDKRITAEVMAEVLDADIRSVNAVLAAITKAGLISVSEQKQGDDVIIERKLVKPLRTITNEQPDVKEIIVRYSYEGPEDNRNRPFCARLLELNRTKVWSRSDIERISERVGYSVWDRRGGWFMQPNGQARPECRHQWKANIIIRKK